VRYPRDNCLQGAPVNTTKGIPPGQSELVRSGQKIAILVFGPFLETGEKIARQYDCTLINMRFVKPLDEERLLELSKNHSHFFCVEDNTEQAGAGSAVNEFISRHGLATKCVINGLKDSFPIQGTRPQVLEDNLLNDAHLAIKIAAILETQ
jgi:1-deoxy-D-xylulose-5-phosphate synthase